MNLLFLCTGNSCRSQMAEGWARDLGKDRDLQVKSAGLEAHGLNPWAVTIMKKQGVDISQQTSDVLSDEMLAEADLLVTVCSHADANCPMLPPNKEKLHMPFQDPANATGSDEEVESCFEEVCLQIKREVKDLLESLGPTNRKSDSKDWV